VRTVAALAIALVACTDDGPGDGGPEVTSHVETYDIPASDGGACLSGEPADVDPDTAGPQYQCSVSDLANYGTANQMETLRPACNDAATPASSTNKPCWAIELDAATCTMGSHYIVRVQRDAQAPADTHVSIQCVTQ
jgi:hypothetical protein